MAGTTTDLERQLAELLEQERFEPSDDFKADALIDKNPPFYKWFEGGTTNASYNCLDRHVEAGLGDRVAFKWRGEEGESKDITYSWLLEQTQRAANALKDAGVEAGDV